MGPANQLNGWVGQHQNQVENFSGLVLGHPSANTERAETVPGSTPAYGQISNYTDPSRNRGAGRHYKDIGLNFRCHVRWLFGVRGLKLSTNICYASSLNCALVESRASGGIVTEFFRVLTLTAFNRTGWRTVELCAFIGHSTGHAANTINEEVREGCSPNTEGERAIPGKAGRPLQNAPQPYGRNRARRDQRKPRFSREDSPCSQDVRWRLAQGSGKVTPPPNTSIRSTQMKRLILLALATLTIAASVIEAQRSKRVKGYVRKSTGTYVAPHRRTVSDRTKHNNYSTKGNVNPYTGKKGYMKPSVKKNGSKR